MGIVDRIKKMFKRKEEIEEYTEENKINTFKEEIKFDLNDYLNPDTCNGENLVPNILRHLGVYEDIISNPKILYDVEYHIKGVISKDGLRLPEKHEIPTREQLEKIVDSIKKNKVLSKEERLEVFSKVDKLEQQKAYYGISIEDGTGMLTTQKLDMTGIKRNESFLSNKHENSAYYYDGSEDIFVDRKAYKVNMLEEEPVEYLTESNSMLYNKDGLLMKKSFILYEKENEEGLSKVIYNSTIRRDSKYPFVAEHRTKTNNRPYGFPVGTKYTLIDLQRLDQMNSNRNIEKQKIREPIMFENREEIEEYFQANKDLIRTSIENGIRNDSRYPLHLQEALNQGIKRMGEEQLKLLVEQQTIEEILPEIE